MVNSSDFRRYSYSNDAAYALDAFNRTRSSAAPDVRPARKKKLSLSPNTKMKSRKELVADQKTAFRQIVAVVCVVAISAGMLFGLIYTYSVKNELNKSISSIKSDIAVAESENVSLNAELEAMVSVSQIDSYAVEKLGMTRLQSNQIRYVDTAEYKAERAAQNSDAEE